ncbi:MAG: aminoglycoside adenylyltransferase domain-containing protein [Pseudonocardiales bacterium]
MAITPYEQLDAVAAEVASHARAVLGDDLVGAYVEGSFALGAGDLHSDVDFIVVMRTALTPSGEQQLRAFHRELPTRSEHWAQHVEGSYALLEDLLDPAGVGRQWLFIDHGHQEMTWDKHGNDMVHRWVLREHGLVLCGPAPEFVVAPVRADDLRAEARRELPELSAGLRGWLDYDIAWCQRYLVINYCRVLCTLVTGTVASKQQALKWAARTLDPSWRPLLEQVIADRSRGFDRDDRPRPGALDASFAFEAYAVDWGEFLDITSVWIGPDH